MAVSVILGTAVLSFALSDTRLAENQEHHLQAEYIARAGADAAAQYVQNHPSEFPTGGFIDRTFTDPSLGEGSFSATISHPFQGGVLVTSTGTAAGASATVTLSLTKGATAASSTASARRSRKPIWTSVHCQLRMMPALRS